MLAIYIEYDEMNDFLPKVGLFQQYAIKDSFTLLYIRKNVQY